MTWTLSPDELDATRAKLAKINDRAAKRGFTGRLTLTTTPTTWTETTPTGSQVTRHGFKAAIDGDAPCYGGHRFLGVVTPVEGTDATVIFRAAPGVEDVDLTPLKARACDHCRSRRTRKQSMLLENTETGERLQVGSTCIKDFFGWDAIPVLLWADDAEAKLRDGMGGSPAGYDTIETLAWAWACVKSFGWAPASSYGRSTRDAVEACMMGVSTADRDARNLAVEHYAEGLTMAPEIIDRLHTEFAGATAGYEGNMLAILNRDAIVTAKTRGLLVSAVPAYQKAIDREAERQAREKAAAEVPSAWLGTVGDKLEVEGTVTNIVECCTMYGVTHLVTVFTDGGVVKTFATARWLTDVNTGDRVTMTGTVKAHSEYEGRRETTLTRTKAQVVSH